MAKWHFHDLHSFKDYVVFVQMYSPNEYPIRDGHGPEDQWTLDLSFEGLRYGLALTAKEKGELPVLAKCREIVEHAYKFYREGQAREGFFKLEQLEKLLGMIPSQ